MDTRRCIVVTPYYNEDRLTLERCIRSVRNQSVNTDHLLVADGNPQNWIDQEGVRHLRLDRSHADCGNTPRGVGALLAASEGFEAIALLDADNWIDTNHIEVCLNAAAKAGSRCDFVVARRRFCRQDGSILPVQDEPVSEHVDTNCFVFLPGSYHLLSYWALMPKPLSMAGDRYFWAGMRARRLVGAFVSQDVTVNYSTMWADEYLKSGETPPEGAKTVADFEPIRAWLRSLSPQESQLASRLAGVSLPARRRWLRWRIRSH
jgi:glycosyltransferase involved in cell wall biosynthesis